MRTLADLPFLLYYYYSNFTAFCQYSFLFPGEVSFPLLYSIANYFDFVNPLFPSFAKYFFCFTIHILYHLFFILSRPFFILFRALAKILYCYTYIITILISFVKGLFSRFILLIGLLYSLCLYNSIFYGGCQGPF